MRKPRSIVPVPQLKPRGGSNLVIAWLCVAAMFCGCDTLRPDQQVAQHWLDALNAHDPDQVIRMLDPDATYSEPPPAPPLGLESLRTRLREVWGVWRDQVYSARTVVAQGNSVAIEWRLQQTHPSGRSVPVEGITVLELQGSHIRAVRNYYNAAVYLQFLKAPVASH